MGTGLDISPAKILAPLLWKAECRRCQDSRSRGKSGWKAAPEGSPHPFVPTPQFIGTASLIVCVLAIVDPNNNPVPRGLEAFTVGLVVLVIGTSMGFNSGYAVNPARDFGPRLFTAIAGWGSEVFT